MNVLKNLVLHFDPLKYRSIIATLSPEPADSCIEEFGSLGVQVKQMKLSRAASFLSGARTLRHLASEVKPDIVHTHGFRADVLAARAGLECPIISTLHCNLFEDYGFAYGDHVGALLARRHFATLKRFDAVIAVSESVADTALQWGVAARVIQNGVDLGVYCPPLDLHHIQALRASLGWPSEAVILLHTGSLSSRKNPVKVVTDFCASGISRQGFLVFAGGGSLRTECEKAAGAASNIVFLGKRKDVPDLLRAADVLISASSSEGLPMALLEGCASGIRVLATDIPPHKYIQRIFPVQMQIFDQEKSESLQTALEGLQPESLRRRFVPSPSTLEMISSHRMSIRYQDSYAAVLQLTSCATLEPERTAL